MEEALVNIIVWLLSWKTALLLIAFAVFVILLAVIQEFTDTWESREK